METLLALVWPVFLDQTVAISADDARVRTPAELPRGDSNRTVGEPSCLQMAEEEKGLPVSFTVSALFLFINLPIRSYLNSVPVAERVGQHGLNGGVTFTKCSPLLIMKMQHITCQKELPAGISDVEMAMNRQNDSNHHSD